VAPASRAEYLETSEHNFVDPSLYKNEDEKKSLLALVEAIEKWEDTKRNEEDNMRKDGKLIADTEKLLNFEGQLSESKEKHFESNEKHFESHGKHSKVHKSNESSLKDGRDTGSNSCDAADSSAICHAAGSSAICHGADNHGKHCPGADNHDSKPIGKHWLLALIKGENMTIKAGTGGTEALDFSLNSLSLSDSLDLSLNNLSLNESGLQTVISVLNTKDLLCNLKKLGLSNTAIGFPAMESLATAFFCGAFSESLEILDLSKNKKIDDAGVKVLAMGVGGIGGTTTKLALQTLDLSDTSIGDTSVKRVAETFGEFSNDLRRLFLSNNSNITDSGITSLAQSLVIGIRRGKPLLSKLEKLDLSNCTSIGDPGITDLSTALRSAGKPLFLPKLQILDLSKTSITDIGIQTVLKLKNTGVLPNLEKIEWQAIRRDLINLKGSESVDPVESESASVSPEPESESPEPESPEPESESSEPESESPEPESSEPESESPEPESPEPESSEREFQDHKNASCGVGSKFHHKHASSSSTHDDSSSTPHDDSYDSSSTHSDHDDNAGGDHDDNPSGGDHDDNPSGGDHDDNAGSSYSRPDIIHHGSSDSKPDNMHHGSSYSKPDSMYQIDTMDSSMPNFLFSN